MIKIYILPTPSSNTQISTLWHKYNISLSQPFNRTFQLYIQEKQSLVEGWRSLHAEEDEFRAYRLETRADLQREGEELDRARQRLEDEREEMRKERERNENSWTRQNSWN